VEKSLFNNVFNPFIFFHNFFDVSKNSRAWSLSLNLLKVFSSVFVGSLPFGITNLGLNIPLSSIF
jgi:hypothetical protein